MDKQIEKILHPRAARLIKSEKPIALIINSPFDKKDNATKLVGKKKVLNDAGFGHMNKKPVYFDTKSEELESLIKYSTQAGKNFTIYTNSHGAPGWYFGGRRSAKSEMQGLEQFAKLIINVEYHTNKEVKDIVLGGCYSGVELYNPETGKYMNSPARLLSILFPDKNVVGFIGHFADSNVTHVYQIQEDNSYQELTLKPENAAVLFRNGSLIERPNLELYCVHEHTPHFIENELGFGETDANDYFKPYFFKEDSIKEEEPVFVENNMRQNLGLKQLAIMPTIQTNLNHNCSIQHRQLKV